MVADVVVVGDGAALDDERGPRHGGTAGLRRDAEITHHYDISSMSSGGFFESGFELLSVSTQ